MGKAHQPSPTFIHHLSHNTQACARGPPTLAHPHPLPACLRPVTPTSPPTAPIHAQPLLCPFPTPSHGQCRPHPFVHPPRPGRSPHPLPRPFTHHDNGGEDGTMSTQTRRRHDAYNDNADDGATQHMQRRQRRQRCNACSNDGGTSVHILSPPVHAPTRTSGHPTVPTSPPVCQHPHRYGTQDGRGVLTHGREVQRDAHHNPTHSRALPNPPAHPPCSFAHPVPTCSHALPNAVRCPHPFARRPHPISCLRATHLPFARTHSHLPNSLAMPCAYAPPNRSFSHRPTYTDPTHPTGLHLVWATHARACTVPLAASVRIALRACSSPNPGPLLPRACSSHGDLPDMASDGGRLAVGGGVF